MNKRQMIYAALAVVGALIVYAWWKARAHVLDPANSQAASNLFDQLNPTVGGTGTQYGLAGSGPGVVQNFIPVNVPTPPPGPANVGPGGMSRQPQNIFVPYGRLSLA